VYNSDVSGIDLTGLAITTKTVHVNITNNGSTPVPGYVYICNSQVVAADMNSDSAMWLKVIAMPMNEDEDIGGGPVSVPSSWDLKVPSDTGDMYFFVITGPDGYASTTPVSGSTVTLDLSAMTPLIVP
jgi:hypothetical protein